MGLIFWWMLIFWFVAIVGYWVGRYFWIKWKGVKEAHQAVPIAHTERLTELPEYKDALKQYQLLLKIATGVMSLALVVSIIISARPASISLITPAQKGRDIMLCLDVSGSVLRADTRLVNRFTALVDGFSGQRFGLTVFNSSSIAILPLSDDYEFIREQLKGIGQALADQKGDAFTNLTSGSLAAFDKGTSLVSDGVTSCINNLGDNPQNRSQSIILATDNESNGTPVITPEQALGLAQKKNIRIYAIDPGESDPARKPDHTKLQQLAEQTGGNYHVLSDADAVSEIIDSVSSQEARYAESTPVVAVADRPKVLAYIAFAAALGSLALAWRLRL